MRLAGLNFDAIPDISSPFRFYLTAPLFAILAAILLGLNGETVWLSRWMPVTLAITHLIALGTMVMIMIGSLFQVMPVLCGVPIPISGWRLTLFHIMYSLGVLALSAGFLEWLNFGVAYVLLGFSLSYFVVVLGRTFIINAKGEQTRTPILLSIVALSALLIIGLLLVSGYLWEGLPTFGKSLTNLHAGIGAFGWVMLLIMAVSFQVIPMFHVTPSFSARWRKGLVLASVLGLVTSVLIIEQANAYWGWIICIISALSYCGLTLKKLSERKRKLPDIVVTCWRCGLSNLALSCVLLLWLLLPFGQQTWTLQWHSKLEVLIGYIFGMGFVLAIIQGMLLKIVPFLITLHLQKIMMQNPMSMIPLPDHYQLISRKRMQYQFRLYIALLTCIAVGFFAPHLTVLIALAFAFNWLCIANNILHALLQYRDYRSRLLASPPNAMTT